MPVGVVYDPVYLQHDTGNHPENKQRLEAILTLLEKSGLFKKLLKLPPRTATLEELLTVHSQEHIHRVRSLDGSGGWLDADTVASPSSYQAALYAVGGVLRAVEAVNSGEVNSVFALVRPPGHHATRERAMGFCFFNNIAIGAKYAQSKGLERTLIADFDVHHGNGTQEIFYDHPDVLYFSTHQYPFYPGTGAIDEIGSGEGKGYTVNVPLPVGCGDDIYREVYEGILPEIAFRFHPQLILVSAGYDAHWQDKIAAMQVSIKGFIDIAKALKELADELCEGRLVFTLEGGYNLKALSYGVKGAFSVLLGDSEIEDPLGEPKYASKPSSAEEIISKVKEIHRLKKG